MEVRIRLASVEDAGAIARVQVEGWRTTYRGIVPDRYLEGMDVSVYAERWRGWLASGKTVTFVAEDAGGVVGFVSGGAIRERVWGYDAELYAIYVLKDRHRGGLGRRLVEELVGVLRKEGFRAMVVWALEANPAVGFYKRLGGRVISGKITEIDGARVPEVMLGLLAEDSR